MDRRDFLKTTGSAAAVAGVVAPLTAAAAASGGAVATFGQHVAPHIVSGVRDLGLVVGAPDNGRGLAENARRLGRRIEELTGGRYRVHVSPQDRAGDADLWASSSISSVCSDPLFSYFCGLPGRHGIAATDLDAWLALSGGQKLWDDLAMAHGFKPLLAGHSGANPAIWSRQPITLGNAFAGLKYAAIGLAGDVARGLGAQPVALKAGEGGVALAAGQIDALECDGAMHNMASGLPEAAKFALAAGINRQGTAQSLAVKLSQWERMTPTDQAAITAACAEEFRLTHAEARVHEMLSWRVMKERHGVTLSLPSPELLEAIDRMSDAAVAHIAASSQLARRVNASFMAFSTMLPREASSSRPMA